MSSSSWWDRFPGRLEWELEALRVSGIEYDFDQEAFDSGVLKLKARLTMDGVQHQFTVTFPDLYPYFRVEIRADDLSLGHHQNPLDKQLCLIGRATEQWDTTDSAAQMLLEQVPKVIAANEAEAAGREYGAEEEQAEPVSEYFGYQQSAMLLIQGDWLLPNEARSGTLTIGFKELEPRQRPHRILRGAVLRIATDAREEVQRANEILSSSFAARTGQARWVRSDTPILEKDPKRFFERLEAIDPKPRKAEPLSVDDGDLTVRAVIFPEETAYHRLGQGWMVVARWRGRRTKKGQQEGYYFARVARAGVEDFFVRDPELVGLRNKAVAMFGLGCIGAPSALELARAGVGELRLLDGDYVDPGTLLRWPIGFSAVGHPKADVLAQVVLRDYPYTRVTSLVHTLGGVRHSAKDERSDVAAVSQMLDGVSLIYDATAEFGIQHYLSDAARLSGIPYVGVAGKQGGWGGYVLRIVPGVTEGCWMCLQYAWDVSIPSPPAAPSPFIQPAGCGNPTFLAAGFDMTQIAMHAVRMTVASLTKTDGTSYPDASADVLVIRLRTDDGVSIAPQVEAYPLRRHPECPICAAIKAA